MLQTVRETVAKIAVDMYRQHYPQRSPYTYVPQTPGRFGGQIGRRGIQVTRERDSQRPNYNARQEIRVNGNLQETAQRPETPNRDVKKKNKNIFCSFI